MSDEVIFERSAGMYSRRRSHLCVTKRNGELYFDYDGLDETSPYLIKEDIQPLIEALQRHVKGA